VLRDGQNEGLIGIYVDLYGVLSIADVALRIERAYAAQLKGPIRKTIENFFLTFRCRVKSHPSSSPDRSPA
jgi:hypothetical protein